MLILGQPYNAAASATDNRELFSGLESWNHVFWKLLYICWVHYYLTFLLLCVAIK